MKLEFDTLSELDAFLTWSGRGKLGSAIPLVGRDPETLTDSVGTTGEIDNPQLRAYVELAGNLPLNDGAVDASSAGSAGEASTPAALAQATGTAPRKRRTKVEIEADKAAQAAVAQGVAAVPAPGAAKPQMSAQEAIQQALAAAELAKQAKSVDAELSQAATAVAGALLESANVADPTTSPTDPKLLPHEFIQKRAAELGELSAIEHLNLARNFIAKHGMPRYNESFTMTGLAANVMTFTPAECATHAAALEWLDQV